MATFIRSHFLTGLCVFALLFAAAAGVVDAQSENPIDEDDILCSVAMGDEVWAAPLALRTELEAATGQTAIVETARSLLGRLPPATQNNGVRFEGGLPSVQVREDLHDLGYTREQILEQPDIAGATIAVRHSV